MERIDEHQVSSACSDITIIQDRQKHVFRGGCVFLQKRSSVFQHLANIVTRNFYSSLFPNEIHIECLLDFGLYLCLIFHKTHLLKIKRKKD